MAKSTKRSSTPRKKTDISQAVSAFDLRLGKYITMN